MLPDGALSKDDEFRIIYEKYVRDISAFAIRRASPEDAADIVSETFLVAWRRFDQLPPNENALPWLYAVARNVLLNSRRGLRRSNNLSKKLRMHFRLSSPISVQESSKGLVAEAMKSLPAADQELLQLVGWEGLKPSEIAVVLGISPETTRTRLHRARQNFRSELERIGFNE